MSGGRVVVVGASLAGLHAADALRRGGHEGTVTLVGAERHLPYDRPPLSKQVLAGSKVAAELVYKPATHFDETGVELVLGAPATALDPAARTVSVGDGDARTISYDEVVIATGSAPRRLPFGHDLDGVHLLRDLDDATAVAAALSGRPRPRVVVIGCGFIGAEAAAAARGHGCEVTIVEALPTPMVRGVGADIGAHLGTFHPAHGVELLTGTGVAGIDGDGSVERVTLTDGAILDADLVIVGIGVAPSTGWLESSGLPLDDGVVCDATLAVAPGVWAAGDVARWRSPRYGVHLRVEHWSNAQEQGMRVGRNILAGPGGAEPYDGVPFFWSDQYEHLVQLAGWPGVSDRVDVLHRGEDRSLVALYGRGDDCVACVTVDRARVLTRLRRQLAAGIGWDDAVAFVGDQLA